MMHPYRVPTVEVAEEPVFEDAEEYQPSLAEELHSRALQAVAAAADSGDYQQEADFDNESDL
eukprot:1581046-Amphidinium_carterae.1